MVSKESYNYASKVVIFSSIIFFILFVIVNLTKYKYNAVLSQIFLTINISLIILSFLIFKGFEQDELNKLLFYVTFIFAIPLIYHILYYMFFDQDVLTKMKLYKIYIAIGIMIYCSLIWFNLKELVNTNTTFSNISKLINNSIRILI
jgi:hypothetical protein